MLKTMMIGATALLLTGSLAIAQDQSVDVLDDSAAGAFAAEGQSLQPDDAEVDAGGRISGAQVTFVGKGPLAYGTVLSNGSKYKGSTNWSSTYNSTYKRYEITIGRESYYYLNYATMITPAGDARFCKSSSVGGKLLVYCYDHAGNSQPSRFGFVTFKP